LSDANESLSGRVPLESPFGKSNEPIAMKIIIFGLSRNAYLIHAL
jgi:hypothetical protein